MKEDRKKLIIQNDSDLSNLEVLRYVSNVMGSGKVSKTNGESHYCFVTVFEGKHKDITVISTINKKSYRFIIRN